MCLRKIGVGEPITHALRVYEDVLWIVHFWTGLTVYWPSTHKTNRIR